MKIINIKKSKLKITVFFENEKLELFPATYAQFNLYINKIIEEAELIDIKKDNEIEGYFLLVIKRLMVANYTPKKIEEFLYKKGANKLEIKQVVEKLIKYDFVNESRLVKEITSYCDSKHYGFNKIIKMANDRKISSKEIAKINYDYAREEKEATNQVKLLDKKFSNKNEHSKKNSIYLSMIRYGFDEDLSTKIINKFVILNQKHEINVLKLDYDKSFLKFSKKYVGYELDNKITAYLLNKGYRMSDIKCVKENK